MHALHRRVSLILPLALVAACASGEPRPVSYDGDAPEPFGGDRVTAFEYVADPAPAYPGTRKSDHVDEYHGTKVPDPYRWLEDDNADETAAWVKAQNKVTFSFLHSIPERAAIRARLEKIWNFERYGAPRVFGGRAFFTRNDGLQNQSVLYVQDSPESEPRVLLDPNTLSEDGTVSIANWQPSFDGTKLGYSISVGGSDWKTIRIRDVLTTVDEPEVLEWCKFTSPSWSADSRGFYYSRYDKPAEGTELSGVNSNVKMHFHTVGTPQSEDPLLYERPDHPKWGFGGWETEDGLWNLVWVWEGSQPRNRIYARDLMDPDGKIEPVLDAFDARYDPVANDGSVLYVFTDKGAPRGRILAIDMKNPAESAWKELVPQREETLDDVKVVDNRFLCIYMRDAHTVVRVHALDGTFERELELPGTGTASAFTGRRGDKHTYYRYTDFGTPSSTYRCEVATGLSELFRAPVVDFDGSRLVTEQVWFKSRDGVKVPMFLTRRWDVEPNGNRPVYLYAYGGFGISMTPFFSISNAVWLERGGILAIPNLRGGGEYGKDW
ncbi:MAG: prolyl oligopeptidase family serine peptidase, partial [Planctomycetota bacterium]